MPASIRRRFLGVTVFTVIALVSAAMPSIAGGDIIDLLPGTAILLDQSSGSGSGGNATSTSSSTNIFSPAAFVDYKRFGGEPTAVVDRYPFFDAACTAISKPSPCFKDTVYVSAPQGFVDPRYSTFYKSTDLGQTFRVPFHFPDTTKNIGTGQGGGDSHLVVGSLSHKVYFVDLALDHITMNVSSNEGENWTTDDVIGTSVGLVDDRQWVEADEAFPATAVDGGNVYISAINLLDAAFPTLIALRSKKGAASGSFDTDSTCTSTSYAMGANPLNPAANDGMATSCPDPSDPYLYVAGPVVADKTVRTGNAVHAVYVPFVRHISLGGAGLDCPCPWQLYVAKSVNVGDSWTRLKVADLHTTVNP